MERVGLSDLNLVKEIKKSPCSTVSLLFLKDTLTLSTSIYPEVKNILTYNDKHLPKLTLVPHLLYPTVTHQSGGWPRFCNRAQNRTIVRLEPSLRSIRAAGPRPPKKRNTFPSVRRSRSFFSSRRTLWQTSRKDSLLNAGSPVVPAKDKRRNSRAHSPRSPAR